MDFITPDTVIPAVQALYFLTARVIKILIFFVIHLSLLVVLLFVLWYFEIWPQDVSRFLNRLFQSPPWQLFAILGGSLTTIALLYMKAWKYVSKKISSKVVWHPAITSFSKLSKEING